MVRPQLLFCFTTLAEPDNKLAYIRYLGGVRGPRRHACSAGDLQLFQQRKGAGGGARLLGGRRNAGVGVGQRPRQDSRHATQTNSCESRVWAELASC